MRVVSLLIFLSSCSVFFGTKEAPRSAKESHYIIRFQSADWIQKKDKRSDYVYQNVQDGKIMLSNSFCDEFQEDSLENLAKKTFQTIKDFRPLKSQYTTFKDREAYRIEGSGLVDGVKVNLQLMNTRRDNCYFDFLAIAPEKTQKSLESFNEFLQSVSFK